jgi:CheY-like chemotaxis protein
MRQFFWSKLKAKFAMNNGNVAMEILKQNARDRPTEGVKIPRMRLLVIDDNESSRDMLRRVLEIGQHEVHVAATGESGLDLILRVKPDVALIDIGLPDISGYEVAKRVRQSENGDATFLAAVTGYTLDTDVEEARLSGFDAHVAKPLDNEKTDDSAFYGCAALREES